MADPQPGQPADPASQATPEAMAEQAIHAAQAAVGDIRAQANAASPLSLPDFNRSSGSGAQAGAIDLLSDVNLNVKVELGRTRMLVEDILRLNTDSVIELDKAAGDPVDIYINGRHIARGEVLVLNENFCVRISEIIQAPDGLAKAG
jgi:flagellar motor switch protein FliN